MNLLGLIYRSVHYYSSRRKFCSPHQNPALGKAALKHIRVYLEISSVSTVRKIFFFAKKDRQIKKALIGVALG
jgi:hypothetical protein